MSKKKPKREGSFKRAIQLLESGCSTRATMRQLRAEGYGVDSNIIFAATYKTYSTISGRRFASDLRDALAKGYISKRPSYNSVFDYFKMESLTPYLKELIEASALPLIPVESDFAVDSSGFSTGQFMRWFEVWRERTSHVAQTAPYLRRKNQYRDIGASE